MSSYISLRYLCVLFVICRVNLAHCENVQEHDKDNNNHSIPTTKPTAYDKAVNKLSVADEKCREYAMMIHGSKANSGSDAIYQSINGTYCNVTTLIAGGEKAAPKEFPHMALLGFVYYDAHFWYGGGSLISKNWILTSAHCIINDTKRNLQLPMLARLGELDYFVGYDDARPRDYKIVQKIMHPKYKADFLYSNDIGLLRLEEDVEFTAYVRPICLNRERPLKMKHVLATGWGDTLESMYSNSGYPPHSELLKVTLDVFSIKNCNQLLSYKVGLEFMNKSSLHSVSQICAGYLKGGKDTCTGDSGGPLQVDHPKYACMYLQVGITSYGYECGAEYTPAVYTRVSNFIPWIEQIVWPKSE